MTMHSLKFPVVLAASLLAVSLGTAAPAWSASADAPTPVSLRAAASTTPTVFNLGETSLLDQPQIVHRFQLQNDGTTPVTLVNMVPSCHCTTATVEPDANGALPTIPPGGHVTVRVSIVAEPYLSGPLDKSVAVFAQGLDQPVATLEINATLRPSVTLTPDTLDFGTVAADQPHALPLTITLDSRLLPDGATPRLVATDPDIQITAQPPTAAPDGSATLRTFAYTVTVGPNAALGPVRDLLHFASTPGAATGLSLADGPAITVTGQVAGVATAEPAVLAFGVVRQGRSTERPLQLDARDAALWQSVKIASDGPWVTAHLAPAQSPKRTLEVTLAPSAPAGSLQSQVTVAFANGEHLRIPVTAYVSTAPAP